MHINITVKSFLKLFKIKLESSIVLKLSHLSFLPFFFLNQRNEAPTILLHFDSPWHKLANTLKVLHANCWHFQLVSYAVALLCGIHTLKVFMVMRWDSLVWHQLPVRTAANQSTLCAFTEHLARPLCIHFGPSPRELTRSNRKIGIYDTNFKLFSSVSRA